MYQLALLQSSRDLFQNAGHQRDAPLEATLQMNSYPLARKRLLRVEIGVFALEDFELFRTAHVECLILHGSHFRDDASMAQHFVPKPTKR